MLCWEWTTSQVSGLGKSPNKLLTEITDTALTVTQPQNQRQTTMDNSNRSLTDPLCHSLQTHPEDPGRAFEDLARIMVGVILFTLPHSVSAADTWARAGWEAAWVEFPIADVDTIWPWFLRFGSAINLGLNLEQVFWGFIFSPIKWLTEIFWDLNGQAYESL